MDDIAQIELSNCETEDTLQSIKKSLEDLVQVCAQLAQDPLSATIEEEEEDERGYKDMVEHTEVVTMNSRDDHDQEYPVVADHIFPHPTSSFEEVGMSKEMQDDLVKEIAWRLTLPFVIDDLLSNPC
ncbi:unnamed protein product [Linum trigynum]|uniref:Uncharacterized protein n=1 Tax=Linum trigynum TaxID=586398 RepID=A0AAV2ERU1_9ROSI